MIWFTWRQFRAQAAITVAAVAIFGILLLFTISSINDMYASVAACQTDCSNAIDTFLRQFRKSPSGTLYDAALGVMYVLPVLIGIFWGAPLIAREFEAGTHRLAWNQSVTRTRWLATKLGLLTAASAAIMGGLSWAVTAWAQRFDSASALRITPMVFGARGIVPIGYAVFAFAVGVTAGMLIRRTVPAMAATLAVYTLAIAAMPLWIRAHLVPATHQNTPLDMTKLQELMISMDTRDMEIIGEGFPNTWVVTNETVTAAGQPFTGPADPVACTPHQAPGTCAEWVGTLGLRQNLTYHPDSNFWPLQLAETGLFLGLAALLIGLCFWWLRRRSA